MQPNRHVLEVFERLVREIQPAHLVTLASDVTAHLAVIRAAARQNELLPLDFHGALFAKLRQSTAFNEPTAVLRLLRPPFLKCTNSTWGLLSRDLPGGVEAMTEALDELETVLERRERGFSALQMQREMAKLSKVHSQWTPEMCQSVTRGDTRFRLSISGNVGLADWESVRVPTRAELVKRSLDEGGGRVSVDAVRDRIAAVYGSAPDRVALGLTANRFGAGLQGDWLVGGAAQTKLG